MISIRQVSRNFGDYQAVRDVSFEVHAGETVVLLGTSGCGKTTTLKMINGLISPSSGTISVNGTDVRQQEIHQLRRQIGYVIQDTGLFPHYTVSENMAIVPRLLNWETQAIQARTRELLTMLKLPESALHRYPSDLSGGQRQRVGLARALAARPAILLMDEPLGALDPVTRAGIRREFRQLDELRQKTIVLVTHDVQEAFELGDRIGLMDAGQLVQLGTPKELLLQPKTDFVRDFLKEQRLFLQLHTFTLTDLVPYLEANSPIETNFRLPAETRLDEVLTQLTQQQAFFEVDNRQFQIQPAAIWTAMNQLCQPT
ncbi:ATP-binding cassette domain-containing protein [Tellurirhabdus bombi]|uniref:ATP-binding cassette domain-containing protein n=1 Tax=Tellurirhabdus bombi TaxID=2907205 RepID=UPI001F36796C|nr:ABC transporter ATP-binding protein [Tellurirhabdus bombi]